MKNLNIALLCYLLAIPSMGFAKDYYGALAVDLNSGIFGGSVDMGSEKEAEKVALEFCKKKGGKGCVIANVFSNSCSALAYSKQKKKGKIGWAESSLSGAENESINRCRSLDKAKDCKVIASVCTSWETYYEYEVW
jgi:hypothetical protein